ncbi:unnamed protein product [Leptidea sinapis]|uniref:BHLH domain-containing protein n=1 Tax=Leptidea sinapis TaxID=189913 RepID=A0A5E4Q180_9NEOP|nr:unnamed protein product [Leptidea sinapis]
MYHNINGLKVTVNSAFNTLRLLIPTEPPDRKLSDMERPCLQINDYGNNSAALCTFCWTASKKDKYTVSSSINGYQLQL